MENGAIQNIFLKELIFKKNILNYYLTINHLHDKKQIKCVWLDKIMFCRIKKHDAVRYFLLSLKKIQLGISNSIIRRVPDKPNWGNYKTDCGYCLCRRKIPAYILSRNCLTS